MWKTGLTLTWDSRRLISIWFSLCLFQTPGTSGLNRHVRQTQNIGAVLNRLSNLETLLIEERVKTVSVQHELSDIKSRLDVLSLNLAAKRPAYDDEFIKSYVAEIMTNTLESIQDGLINEKQQRLRLEDMALEIKDIQQKATKRLDQNRNMLEKRIIILERTYSTMQTIDQTRPTIPPNRPFVRQNVRPTKSSIRPTSLNYSYYPQLQSAPSRRPSIVGGVKFSGQALNHNENRIAKDCSHLWDMRYRRPGVYRIHIKQGSPVLVYCTGREMLVQRRKGDIGLQDFRKSWNEYKYGFGNFDSDFWIGNEILWQAINSSSLSRLKFLRIWLSYPASNQSQRVEFLNPQMTNEADGYQLLYSHHTNRSGFLFADQIPGNGSRFMTRDRHSRGGNCSDFNGGWWYKERQDCTKTSNNPNSRFTDLFDGIMQRSYSGYLSFGKPDQNISTIVTKTKILFFYRNLN